MSVPTQMRAVIVPTFGGPEVMVVGELPTPTPGAGEVLIHVAAAGVNRPDVFQRQGAYPPPPGAPATLGLEIAGTVAAIGPDAGRWRVGDAVCALVAGGGYAEYCLAPVPQCLPVPSGLSIAQAAAIPETFFTVWTNVFDRGRLVPGETLLVHGGSSGIGTTAIQLAHALGSRVLTTAGSDAKCEACRALGADVAINYRTSDWSAAVTSATGGRGVDVILDMVGGPYVAKNLDALAIDGRLVQISFLEGSRVDLDLRPIMGKRLTLTGSTLRPRTIAEKGAIARVLEARVWPLLASGMVRPLIDRTFPLADVVAAHRRMESSAHIGKIVLTM
jgi:putative PIG3 family NAD(P)H quinone oxidoreductase